MTADNNTCHRIKKFCWQSNPKSPGLLFWVFYTLEEQSFQQWLVTMKTVQSSGSTSTVVRKWGSHGFVPLVHTDTLEHKCVFVFIVVFSITSIVVFLVTCFTYCIIICVLDTWRLHCYYILHLLYLHYSSSGLLGSVVFSFLDFI